MRILSLQSGEQISVFNCGNGISTIKLFKNKFLMLGCYDGFIYVVDKENGHQLGRIPGAGKMVLGLAVAGNKVSYLASIFLTIR